MVIDEDVSEKICIARLMVRMGVLVRSFIGKYFVPFLWRFKS